MKMRCFIFILIILLPVITGWISFGSEWHTASRLRIIYRNPVPPDSIKQFLSVCFQLNKKEVINDIDHRDLFMARMSEVSKEWMEKGNLKELADEAGKKRFNEEVLGPFKNNLILRFFSDTTITTRYKIDSIQWQVVTLVDFFNGDTLIFNSLLPGPEQLDKPYVLVKTLVDKVVASGLIK
jgi:hypothetical protein